MQKGKQNKKNTKKEERIRERNVFWWREVGKQGNSFFSFNNRIRITWPLSFSSLFLMEMKKIIEVKKKKNKKFEQKKEKLYYNYKQQQ